MGAKNILPSLDIEQVEKYTLHVHSFVPPGVRVFLRGKAHVEWKMTKGGERRTVKEDQYFMDEKAVVWGKGRNLPINTNTNTSVPLF